jgi:hypothetical protein
MSRFENIRFQLHRPSHGGFEILEFNPQEYTVSIRTVFGVSKRTVMMFDVPIVQLENEGFVPDQALILFSSVIAPTPKETLIPFTARLDVAHADKGLYLNRVHFYYYVTTASIPAVDLDSS